MDTASPDEPLPPLENTQIINNGDQQTKQQPEDTLPATPVPEIVTQKRVLPTRSRRGGPGVGSCEIDLSILDAQRRAEENKPLIPPSTTFLLVTDSSLVPFPVEPVDNPGAKQTSNTLHQSYFDRPEVARAFREQKVIETPVCVPLPPSDAVGGRLRARTGDEDNLDTSDGAYIARHRKYETFEKRQRRREKEKLVNEHQKLKARIEQLRSMDAAAFGGKDAEESERRRRSMLTTAEDLEHRYRVLLPEPRHRIDKKAIQHAMGSELDEESQQPSKRLTIKISRPSASLHATPPSWRSKSEAAPKPRRGRPPKTKLASTSYAEMSQELSRRVQGESSQSPDIPIMRSSRRARSTGEELHQSDFSLEDVTHRLQHPLSAGMERSFDGPSFGYPNSPSHSGESNGDPPYLPSHAPSPSAMTDTAPSGRGRKPKRLRISLNRRIDAQVSSHQIAFDANPATCALLRQAMRTDPSARKTKRTHEPLGAKLGPRVEEPSDYEAAMAEILTTFRLLARPSEPDK